MNTTRRHLLRGITSTRTQRSAKRGFEAFLVNLGFAPGERPGGLIVAGDKGIDVFPELGDPGKARAVERQSTEDGEPAFDLVEPGGVRRREGEMNVFVARSPAPALGLVGVEVVEDDV